MASPKRHANPAPGALERKPPVTAAIVGRPNVGKSTLFNRLAGRRLALVDESPGVTRDLREADARLGPLRLRLIDTAGLERARDGSLESRMRGMTLRAVSLSDICLFVFDARAGVTSVDRELAGILRRSGARVVLLANKCEGGAGGPGILDSYSLGFGDPVAVSAEHGEGLGDLAAAVASAAPALGEDGAGEPSAPGGADDSGGPLRMAVVGRPNAGKSTLVNAIAGEDRMLTGPEAGITRDAVSTLVDWGGSPVRIFDTAGMRRKSRVTERLERLSVSDGIRAVRFAEVVCVVLDSAIALESQDLRIADFAAREGRAVVLAMSKWDLSPGGSRALGEIRRRVDRLLPQLKGVPAVPVSALTGFGLGDLRAAVDSACRAWNLRVGTGELNRWLEGMVSSHPPPAPSGRRIRLRYITQASARPPCFVVMCSNPGKVPASYLRYLVNGLRDDFGLAGSPIRLVMRSRADRNPHAPAGFSPRASRLAKRAG